jgi:hypothetical protein
LVFEEVGYPSDDQFLARQHATRSYRSLEK